MEVVYRCLRRLLIGVESIYRCRCKLLVIARAVLLVVIVLAVTAIIPTAAAVIRLLHPIRVLVLVLAPVLVVEAIALMLKLAKIVFLNFPPERKDINSPLHLVSIVVSNAKGRGINLHYYGRNCRYDLSYLMD